MIISDYSFCATWAEY